MCGGENSLHEEEETHSTRSRKLTLRGVENSLLSEEETHSTQRRKFTPCGGGNFTPSGVGNSLHAE